MSRVAKKPIELPKGVEIKLSGRNLSVKGPKGELHHEIHEWVKMDQQDNVIQFADNLQDGKKYRGKERKQAVALAGTTRALVNNMVTGVSAGFERKLELVGVGYRAQAKGSTLNLTLGFSHPVEMAMPEGITVQTPSQTEIIVAGSDKQRVGQVAAKIRALRPPEPYKGKGVRYANEQIVRKEAKKK